VIDWFADARLSFAAHGTSTMRIVAMEGGRVRCSSAMKASGEDPTVRPTSRRLQKKFSPRDRYR